MTLFTVTAVLARHYSLHGGSGGIPTAIYHLPNQVSHPTFVTKMASNYNMLPPPPILEIHDTQAAEKWKRFKRAWTNYSLATGLSEKAESVQVATLLTVISSEAREVFSTFSDWDHEGDDAKIQPVLAKFEQCTANHARISCSNGTGSTVAPRSQARPTTSTTPSSGR